MPADPTHELSQVDESAMEAAEDTPITPVEGQGGNSEKAAEEAVAAKMNEIFNRNDTKNQADELEEEGITSPDNPDGHAPEAEKTHKPEAKADDEAAAGEQETADEQQTDEEKAEAAERKKVIDSFDPNLKRVAKELGNWKPQDIDDFIVSNPTLARVTFSNMAAGYNNLSLQYAQGVRSATPAQPQQQPATTQNVSPLDELLANPAKMKALTDVAGEDLVKAFIKPLLDERKQMLEDRAYVANLRREAVVREVNDGFTNIAQGGFEEFYGKNGEVTQEQNNNRFKVGQLADQIRSGAQLQNVNMGIHEALRRAHLIVTADQNRAQARKEIVKQVKQRSTQITARPTARRSKEAPSARGDAAAIAAVNEFWDQRNQ